MQGTHSTYPKGGVSCFADSFVVAESSVIRMKFSGKNPALRVAAKRYELFEQKQNGVSQPLYGISNNNEPKASHKEKQILVTGEEFDPNTP